MRVRLFGLALRVAYIQPRCNRVRGNRRFGRGVGPRFETALRSTDRALRLLAFRFVKTVRSRSGLAGNEHRLGEASLVGELAHEVALALECFHALRVEADRLQRVVGELHCDHVAV